MTSTPCLDDRRPVFRSPTAGCQRVFLAVVLVAALSACESLDLRGSYGTRSGVDAVRLAIPL
ncbi:hypothetical protein HNR56_000456 [Roseospira marina]|nr:hypothetical protein [Roseospira marina]MBB5085784.1 hypothetical protein [Roseospira marina]